MGKKAGNRRHPKYVKRHPDQGALSARAADKARAAAFCEAVVQDEQQAVWRILSAGHTAANALKLGAHVIASTSERIAQSPYLDQHACRAGCSWCCYIPVAVTPPEALVVAQYLREHTTTAELTAMQSRLAANAVRIARLSSADHADARIPCALLRDGRCSVYEARPIRCRRWHSVDSAACEVGFYNAQAAVVPVDPYAFDAGGSVQTGLGAGAVQAGLDGAQYELHSAVSQALEITDAADRWVGGEPVFQACTPIERNGDATVVTPQQ